MEPLAASCLRAEAFDDDIDGQAVQPGGKRRLAAEAIRVALEMEPEEKQLRMQRMRKIVEEHNIYRWAGTLIAELCEVRLEVNDEVNERLGASASVA